MSVQLVVHNNNNNMKLHLRELTRFASLQHIIQQGGVALVDSHGICWSLIRHTQSAQLHGQISIEYQQS
jgi:hypothetical protein